MPTTTGFAKAPPKKWLEKMGTMSIAMTEFWGLNFWLALLGAEMKSRGPGAGVVLAYFGGSDWCHPCQDLDSEVFQSSTFKNWFKQRKMVPFHADYPMYHSQDPILVQQNSELMVTYNIQFFPSVLAIQADGAEIDRLVGYNAGYGPTKWIQDFSNMSGVP